jgi:hypothetical protein
MSRPELYSYVRFTWWTAYDIKGLYAKFVDRFTVRMPSGLQGESLSLIQRDIYRMEVKADSLVAYVAPSRAVLSQKESRPFTMKDLELREAILELYPHVSPGPFPFYNRKEPPFRVEE